MTKDRRPILIKGERLASQFQPATGGGPKKYLRTFDEARQRLAEKLSALSSQIETRKHEDDYYVCVRMTDKFMAKSFAPALLHSRFNMRFVGGRNYKNADGVVCRLYFVKMNEQDRSRLKQVLEIGDMNNSQREQIMSIDSIDLLSLEEKVLGFDESWTSGPVEMVFHPESDGERNLNFLADLQSEILAVNEYESGLKFISVYCNREELRNYCDINSMRSIKPQGEMRMFEEIGAIIESDLKLDHSGKPVAKLGVFDGGFSAESILSDYVTSEDVVSSEPEEHGLNHGTGVCSAAIYGPVQGTKMNLSKPKVAVDMFRVLPASVDGTIDAIANVVKSKPDTKVYNLSFGPDESVIDEVSRFTYVLDKLMYEHKVMFVTAVGNDGENPIDENRRVQTPSDAVNGIAVGSYCYSDFETGRASYSCIGPGREGAKIKPDLLSFGGDLGMPFYTLEGSGHELTHRYGTSFSAPVISSKVARLESELEEVDVLVAKALLIHNAKKGQGTQIDEGFGLFKKTFDELVTCTKNEVTLLYRGKINEKQYIKLPIVFPEGILPEKARVQIEWTIALLTDVSDGDPDNYTDNSVEYTFYPNENVHYYSKGSAKYRVNERFEAPRAQLLLDDGYDRSRNPVSHSTQKKSEADLKKKDLKWDTTIHSITSCKAKSLDNPCLVLHGMERRLPGHYVDPSKKIEYAVVATVKVAEEYELYDPIVQQNPVLEQIRTKVQIENQLEVQ